MQASLHVDDGAAEVQAGAAEPQAAASAAPDAAVAAPAKPRHVVMRAPLPPQRPVDLDSVAQAATAPATQMQANAPSLPDSQGSGPQGTGPQGLQPQGLQPQGLQPQAAEEQPAADDAPLKADTRLAARAPLPPARPDDLDSSVSQVAMAPQAQPAEVASQATQAALQAPAAPAPSSGGFDLFKFLAGKPQGGTTQTAGAPVEDEPRHGRRYARGAARDAAARARIAPLIERHARAYGIPVALADAVIRVESRYNPSARNGPYLGLSQIHLNTARAVGYGGGAQGLMDADTNLRYGMKYLAIAYRLAGGDTCRTILKYQAGHRAERMTSHAARYCSRVRTMMAAF
ncbi:lytic transglycosylase domain-containing protein [Camelimonas lactis]|uniref:Transglycosylase-like protein with SLT domain n=1 Tax=Camelimonas lactis TaxID=659006 RepID=A0A4R2GXU3_9HYPH|nr:lytic transglycosylase domain-containing protein [Camelimonas lactis]TCO16071.1 transglycosylase-like protein with SLT domain [Camelimonas lactis]